MGLYGIQDNHVLNSHLRFSTAGVWEGQFEGRAGLLVPGRFRTEREFAPGIQRPEFAVRVPGFVDGPQDLISDAGREGLAVH